MTNRSSVLSPIVNALAVFGSLLPLGPLLAGRAYLVESGILIAAVGVVGLIAGLLRLGPAATLALQLVAAGAVVVWRALTLSPGHGVGEAVLQLLADGAQAIAGQAPPLGESPGVLFVTLLFAAVIQLTLELLVRVLDEPIWAFAPLSLGFVVATIASSTPQSGWHFAVVACAYVGVLLVGTRIREGQRATSASRTGAFQLTRVGLAAGMTAAGVVASLLLAPLVTVSDQPLWQGRGTGPIQLSDPTIALNDNLRRPENRPAFTYRTSDGQPLYFRTVALPDLTADGARLVPMQLRMAGLDGAYDRPGREVVSEVQMESFSSEYLPAPFAPDSFDATGVWSHDPETLAIVAAGEDRLLQTIDLSYSVTSTVPSPAAEEIAAAEAGTDADPITLSVPDVDSRVRALTQEVTAGETTAGGKALAMQRFLRSDEFGYSLDAPSTASADAISSFLLTDRSGYCIHFAAAMMTMARIEGIPSRMAVGFNSGTPQGDGSFAVTTHNMHAWPELYFQGLGWIPFEPTPSVASPPSYTDPDQSSGPSEPQSSPPPSASPEPSTSSSPSPDTAEPPSSPSPSPAPVPDGGDAPGGGLPLGWVLAIVGVLLLAAAPPLIRTALARWRLRPGQTAAALATGAWLESRALFVDAGRRWPGGSPGPAARSVGEDTPAGAALARVAGTVERALFARNADVTDLPGHVNALRRALRTDVPLWRRWLPRSLWRR